MTTTLFGASEGRKVCHASKELIDAMLGFCPKLGGTMEHHAGRAACTLDPGCQNVLLAYAYGQFCNSLPPFTCVEHAGEITCLRCLVAMDAAREGRRLEPGTTWLVSAS